MASNGTPPEDEGENLTDPVSESEQMQDIKLDEIDGLDNSDFSTDTLEFEMVNRRPKRKFYKIKPLLFLIVIFGAGYFTWEYRDDILQMSNVNDLPIVRASDEPFKVRPAEPGGKDFPNRDKLVYDRLERKPPKKKSEILLPRPELPLLPSRSELTKNSELITRSDNQNLPPKTIGNQPTTEEVRAVEKPSINIIKPQIQQQDTRSVSKVVPKQGTISEPNSAFQNTPKIRNKKQLINSFQIQLAAVRSAASAKKEWKRLRAQNVKLLGKLKLNVARVDLGKQGIFFRLRAGPLENRMLAKALCRSLTKAKVGCLVVAP